MTAELWFDSRQRQEIFPTPRASKSALGPIQPSIQWVPHVIPKMLKQLGHEDLVPRLRIGGAQPYSPSAFMECTETALP
jgi:hypothetical protein